MKNKNLISLKIVSLLIINCSFLIKIANAQIVEQGVLFDRISATINNLPGKDLDNYQDPDFFESQKWEQTLLFIVSKNWANASQIASQIDYQIVHFTDTSKTSNQLFYILEKTNSGNNFWGTYVFNPNPCREKVIIQCPHPRADLQTGFEGIYIYQNIEAFAYFLNGTHRCNSNTFTSCSGTTSICTGTSESYRKSDVAHHTESPFQLTTQVLHDNISDLAFFQLHGFSKRTTDPYLILGNGARNIPVVDYAFDLSQELYKIDTSLSFKIGHIDTNWTRLLGFWNTQGRYINGSIDPCNQNATQSNGQFIHIEQEFTKFRDGQNNWDKMSQALGQIFPCIPSNVLELEIKRKPFVSVQGNGIFKFYFPDNRKYKIVIYNALGQNVSQLILSGNQEIPMNLSLGIYFISLQFGNQILDNQKIVVFN